MRRLLAIPDRLVLPTSPAGRLFGLLFCLVLVGVTLIPAHSVQIWLTRDLALRWISMAFFALAVLGQWGKESENGVHLDALDLLALVGLGWFSLSAWNSDQPFDAFYTLRAFISLVLFWFGLRAGWRRWPELFPWFLAFFFGTALVASFWVMIGTARNHLIPLEGPFANINFAAAFIGMAFLTLSARLWRGGGPWMYPVMGILFLGWVAARSRGSLVAMAVTLVVYVLLHTGEFEDRLSRWSLRRWLVSGAVVLAMLSLSAPMVNRLLHAGEQDPRANWRILIWKSSWEMAADHPLLGTGPGVYGAYYPYYKPARVWFNENPFAHNEYLQAAAEVGWTGLVWAFLVVGGLLASLTSLSRKPPDLRGSAFEGQAIDSAFFCMLMMAVHASLDFVLHEWCVVFALMALVSYALRHRVDLGVSLILRFSPAVRRLTLSVAVLTMVWVMGVGSLRDERAQRLHTRALLAGSAGDAAAAEALDRRSLDFAPRYAPAWNTLAYLADYLAQRADNPAKKTELLQQAADLYREALGCAPQEMTYRENQVEFYMENGGWMRALELQRNLTLEAPNHLPNYDREAKICLALHRPQEAVALCDLAIQKKDTYLPAVLVQMDAYLRIGKPDLALKAGRKALSVPPDETEPSEMGGLRERLAGVVEALQKHMKEE